MDRTAQLGLPLVMPAQAQKHVTVNEALAILDAVAQLRLVSVVETAPPPAPRPGETFAVPLVAEGEWTQHGGKLATFANGGWTFLAPRLGWRAWVEMEGRYRVFDGLDWIADAVALAPGGAAVRWLVHEFDHLLTPGPVHLTEFQIPANAVAFGITGRVLSEIHGDGLQSWRLGVAESPERYGSGLGTAVNSYVLGMTGSPLTYYAPTPLLLSAEGGTFAGGLVRLCVTYLELTTPRPI